MDTADSLRSVRAGCPCDRNLVRSTLRTHRPHRPITNEFQLLPATNRCLSTRMATFQRGDHTHDDCGVCRYRLRVRPHRAPPSPGDLEDQVTYGSDTRPSPMEF